MLRPRKAVLICLGLLSCTVVSAAPYKPGEVIVKYKNGVTRTRVQMNTLYQSAGVQRVRRYSQLMKGMEQLILDDGKSVESAIELLRRDSTVEYAHPNYYLYALPVVDSGVSAPARLRANGIPCIIPGIPFPPGCDDEAEPSPDPEPDPGTDEPTDRRPKLKDSPVEVVPPVADPDLDKAWGVKKSNSVEAWKIHRGSRDFIVADIDTGIDYNHEDLAFNLWRNPNPTEKNDVVGFDFIHNDGLPFDDQSHGTHTAGTIGAVGGNGVAISGVIQQVSLMALKFLSKDGSGTTADAIRAIDYAVEHGAKVLSNSWGGRGDPDNKALFDAIDRARVKGVLFIAAAGNSSEDNDNPETAAYPASFDNDNLISVVATDQNDRLAYFSNFGKKATHLAAPGVKVYSTVPDGKYASLSGTSMACPHVAGAAALIWSAHPEWDYKKVKQAILKTVDLVPSLSEKTATGGRLNVLKALQYQGESTD